MTFAHPAYFLLLLLLIPYILWFCKVGWRKRPTLLYPLTFSIGEIKKTLWVRLVYLPELFRSLVFISIVIALAGPQTHSTWSQREVEGIDIMMAMDVSTSMLAEDLKPNRIEASKTVATKFIQDRRTDNIGLTIFAGEAFTQCPMTTDHASLLTLLNNVRTDIAERGMIEDGTAIGMGLANAITRLKESKAKSKVVILLTDGSNNRGDISPMTAAEIAKSLGIRVYTIAVGSNSTAPYPMRVGGTLQYVTVNVELDTKTLTDIAATTDGKFYRATNNKQLEQIYHDIDQLEKSKLTVNSFGKWHNHFQIFLLIAFILIVLEILLRLVVFRQLP